MEVIKNIHQTTDKGVDASKKYISTSYQYTKLKVFQLVALSISNIVKLFCIGGVLFIGLIFLAIATANFVGEYYNNIALGYMLVGVFFLIISIITFTMKKYLEKKVIQSLSKFF